MFKYVFKLLDETYISPTVGAEKCFSHGVELLELLLGRRCRGCRGSGDGSRNLIGNLLIVVTRLTWGLIGLRRLRLARLLIGRLIRLLVRLLLLLLGRNVTAVIVRALRIVRAPDNARIGRLATALGPLATGVATRAAALVRLGLVVRL